MGHSVLSLLQIHFAIQNIRELYSVDSIKRTVLLKVPFGTVSIKRTVFNSYFKKISIKNTVYQEKEVREKLNVRYV